MVWKLAILYGVTAAYFVQAAILMFTGDRSGAVIILGYAVANVGLISQIS